MLYLKKLGNRKEYDISPSESFPRICSLNTAAVIQHSSYIARHDRRIFLFSFAPTHQYKCAYLYDILHLGDFLCVAKKWNENIHRILLNKIS